MDGVGIRWEPSNVHCKVVIQELFEKRGGDVN